MSILQRNKKAAVGIGVTALAVAAIALGTGTYAAFQDVKAGPGGTLAAGTLTLDVSTTPSGQVPLFSASNIAPGYKTPTPLAVTVKNTGSLNGTLDATITATTNGAKGDALKGYLTVSGDCGGNAFKDVPVSNIGSAFPKAALNAGASYSCNFTFAFPNTTAPQNDAQGGQVDFTSNFTLNQAS